MIKPYYKSQVTSNLVEVEDFGVINLEELPIRVRLDEKGYYEISWASIIVDGGLDYILSECGGVSSLDFGGRSLGVIREIK